MLFQTLEYQQTLAIQQFANVLADMQVGSETLDAVLADIEARGGVDEAFNAYYAGFGADSATAAAIVADNMNINTDFFDAATVDAAVVAIQATIDGAGDDAGAAILDLVQAWSMLDADPIFGDAVTAFNDEIAVAMAYEGAEDVAAGTVVVVDTTLYLTADQDVLSGSDFVADVVQAGGPQVNSLGTGDRLTGTDDVDTLMAQVTEGVFMGGGNMPIQPRTTDVDNAYFEALFSNIGLEAFDLNLGSLIHGVVDLALGLPDFGQDEIMDVIDIVNDTTVYVNAKNMDGVDSIGSWYSDADLVIQDLTTVDGENVRATEDMTIVMGYTGNSDHVWNESDLSVYFDEDYLLSTTTFGEKSIQFLAMNEDNYDLTVGTAGFAPLDGVFFRELSFTLNGTEYDLTPYLGEDAGPAGLGDEITTYPEFLAAVQAALVQLKADNAGDAALQSAQASLGSVFTTDISPITGDLREGTAVLITVEGDTNGSENSLSVQENDLEVARAGSDAAVPNNNRYELADADVEPPVTDLRVNIELEKAGRGGDGGSLVVGGMNKDGDNEWGDGSPTKPAGIDIFDVTVMGEDDLPSSLSQLRSTNNALRVVNVVSEEGLDSYASLAIGNSNTNGFQFADIADVFVPGLLFADPRNGVPFNEIGIANFDNALKDVEEFNAMEFMGDLTLFAGITDEAIAKSLDLVDEDGVDLDDVMFDYDGGSADDFMAVQIDSDAAAHEDFHFNLSGNDGDDFLTVAIMNSRDEIGTLAPTPRGELTNWYADQRMLDQIDIFGGAGNDTIWTPGAGDMNIYGGSGDDRIYTDNSAGLTFNDDNGSVFLLNTRNFAPIVNQLDEEHTDANDSYLLFNSTLTVSFLGHDVTVDLMDNDGVVTDLEINNAIKEAVNGAPNQPGIAGDPPGLGGVLFAQDANGYALEIDVLISGETEEEDLVITLNAPTSLSAGELAQLNGLWGTAYTEAGAIAAMNAVIAGFDAEGDYMPREAVVEGTGPGWDEYDGDNDDYENDNWVLPGTGDDLIVLGTFMEASSNDTVAYEGYGNGFDCIYNFAAIESFTVLENLATVVVDTQGADVPATVTTTFAEIFTLEVTAAEAPGTITFGGATATITASMSAADVVAEFVATGTFGAYTATAGPTGTTVTFTETVPGGADLVDVTVADFVVGGPPTVSGVLVGVVNDQDGGTTTTGGTPSATEVFTVTFGDSSNDVTYTFDGETIPVLDGETAENITLAVAAGDYDNWDVTGSTATTVTFTHNAGPAAVADVVDANWVGANIMTPVYALVDWNDMLDFTDYAVDAVVVNGVVIAGALGGIGDTYVELDESAVNPGEYLATHGNTTDGAWDGGTDDDVLLGTIGTIDFGDTVDFAAASFII